MSVRDWFRDWVLGPEVAKAMADGAQAGVPGANTIPTTYTAYADQGISPSVSYSTLVAGYKSWVYIAVNKIAQTVSSLPLNLYAYTNSTGKYIRGHEIKRHLSHIKDRSGQRLWLKQQGVERVLVTDHPFLDLMQRPNPLDTRVTLWNTTIQKLELNGSVGWYMPRNGLGAPAEIIPLPLTSTASLRPKPSAANIIDGWVYQDGNLRQEFDLEEVAWIRYPSPNTPYEGMSALKAQTYPYDIDDYLQKYQYYVLKNKATPGLLLSTDARLREEQVQSVINQIKAQWGGTKNAGQPMILHSGLKEAGRANQGFDELAVGEIDQAAQDKLLSAYGVPAGKIGLVKDVNRANMEALDKTFTAETIKPRLMIIEEVIERDVLPLYDDRLTLDFELPSTSDRTLDLQERQQNLASGYTTINEEREATGREPVEWGDVPWMPAGLIQHGEDSRVEVPKEDEEEEKAYSAQHWTKARKAIECKAAEQRVQGSAKPFAVMMRKVFKRQRDEILDKLEREGKGWIASTAGYSRRKRQQLLSRKALPLAAINLVYDDEVKQLREALTPLYVNAAATAGQARMDQLEQVKAAQFTFTFDVEDPAVDAWIAERGLEAAKEITTTTMQGVKAILRDGLAEGAALTDIAQNITEKFSTWSGTRANTVAWTESHTADNFADLESVKQSGMSEVLRKFWIASTDTHTRDTHATADIDYADGIPIDQDFAVGSDSMSAPGLGSVAAENINCRCTLGYTRG